MPASGFKDYFSGHAAAYAEARPHYPASLFEFLAGQCRGQDCAWDCATGSGQAALQLATHFKKVLATDASAQQIGAAEPHERVSYRVATAEASGLEPRSVDLVTVAQALHWFDVDRFFGEVRRVIRPGGVLAAWCYGNCQVTADVDRIVLDFYESLDPYWPPERRILERGYSDIDLPFTALDCPTFELSLSWTADALLAYIDTWSAVQRCSAATGHAPVADIAEKVRAAWGAGSRAVSWPLYLKASRHA